MWRNCVLRIFALARIKKFPNLELTDNSIQIKLDLQATLQRLRIKAIVDVIELNDDNGIDSEFAYEKTLKMQHRTDILKRLGPKSSQHVFLLKKI